MISTAILAVAALLPASQPNTPVSWADVRSALGQTICAVAEPRAPKGYWVSVGDRQACGVSPAARPLDQAIDAALEQSQPLLIAVPPAFLPEPPGLDSVYAAKEAGERNRLAAEAYLKNDDFLRAVLPRLRTALEKEGLACTGCPTFEAKGMKRLKWEEFFPYVSTFVRPDPVRTPVDKDGKPTGMPRYSFHVCSGLADTSEMKNPDPVLTRAGFVAVFPARKAIQTRTGFYFGNMLDDEAFQKLQDDKAKTAYLREHLAESLRKDPAVQEAICSALAPFSADLGVELTDCPVSTK